MRDFWRRCLSIVMLLVVACQDRDIEGKYGPLTSLTIEVTGDDFQWYNRYPGVDGEFQTDDDIVAVHALHVPANTRTKLLLSSRDYVYTLALPHLQLKEVAVPEMTFTLEFLEQSPGIYELLGDQLCGYTHPNLLGELVVESRSDFEAWLDRQERQP